MLGSTNSVLAVLSIKTLIPNIGAGHAAYTDRFHELARLVPHLVTLESRMIERYVYGLALQICGMVAATEPKTMQKAVQISGALTDEAVVGNKSSYDLILPTVLKGLVLPAQVVTSECMQTRSSSKFVGEPSTNPNSTIPKRHNRRHSIQRVEPFSLVETPVVTMVDQRIMADLLRAPTEGYAEEIVVPPIPAEHFELKHSLINLVTSKQLFDFEKEDPHAHFRYFNKITSTLKYKDVPETSIKLMLFPFSIDGPARIWLDKEPPRSILTWDDL
ncbi:hypothetical protein Tco_0734014, partial [Tanacetum coccineum]